MVLEYNLEEHILLVNRTLDFINNERKEGYFPIDESSLQTGDVLLFGNGLYAQASPIYSPLQVLRYGVEYDKLDEFIENNFQFTSIYIPLNRADEDETIRKISLLLRKLSPNGEISYHPIIQPPRISLPNARQAYMKFYEYDD